MATLTTLIERALDLETIDVNLFRSSSEQLWKPLRARGVFGGQIIGLALSAATKTVPDQFLVHSLHCYFLLPGNSELPIIYTVEKIRDGKTFSTRNVTARQNGRIIFICSCSFQIPETSLLTHQYEMPNVPSPEQLSNNEDILRGWLADPKTPSQLNKFLEMRLLEPIPVEFKPVKPVKRRDIFLPQKSEPKQMVWMRAKGKLPDNLAFHQCVAAYLSDHYLLNTSLLSHGVNGFTRDPQLSMIATLDHSIWFHCPFRADDWLLYEMESTRTGSGRGLCLGRVFSRDGVLVMSCAQEGVIRAVSAKEKNAKERNANAAEHGEQTPPRAKI